MSIQIPIKSKDDLNRESSDYLGTFNDYSHGYQRQLSHESRENPKLSDQNSNQITNISNQGSPDMQIKSTVIPISISKDSNPIISDNLKSSNQYSVKSPKILLEDYSKCVECSKEETPEETQTTLQEKIGSLEQEENMEAVSPSERLKLSERSCGDEDSKQVVVEGRDESISDEIDTGVKVILETTDNQPNQTEKILEKNLIRKPPD